MSEDKIIELHQRPKMTPEFALECLQQMPFVTKKDPEVDHRIADGILCDVLMELGYSDLVDAYEKITKWYA